LEEVKLIEPIGTCKECAKVFNEAGTEETKRLIEKRKNLPRCQGCYRITGEGVKI
jgi:hypothetical protein